MSRPVVAFIAAAIIMLALDALWLTLATPILYRPALGSLLADPPNLAAAAAFYLLYLAGVFVFAVRPALATLSVARAARLGGFFGLVAYGTYDLTNLATLAAWPLGLTFIDMLWGTALTALVAAAAIAAARRFGRT